MIAAGLETPRYLIISGVKDEELYVERTLRSVAAQTVLPIRWIIVDDGSTDTTPEILARYAREYPWIEVVSRERAGARQPGAEIQAFYQGLAQAKCLSFEYLIKLDCDVELPPNYFSILFRKFESDPRLGIASGVYLEEKTRGWRAVPMPDYHAAGASKVMRRTCFEEVGGFICALGWDTVDEVRAQLKGWATGHFSEAPFRHLKPEGASIGRLRTSAMHGEIYFLTGGGPFFLLFKVAHRMVVGAPPVAGGVAMLFGYLRCWISGREKVVTALEERHYRKLLHQRLLQLWRTAKLSGESSPQGSS